MRKVLLVDDEKIERNGIRMLLQRMPEEFEIREASNGVEALRMLREETADMVLTDIKMPQMDGIELIEKIREYGSQMPIAIFSGYGEFDYAQKAIRNGVSNYILKPVKPQEFEETIRKILRTIEQREQEGEKQRESRQYLYRHYLKMYLETGKSTYAELLKSNPEKSEQFNRIQCMMLMETEDNFVESHEAELEEKLPQFLDRELGFLSLDMNQLLILFYQSASNNYMRIGEAVREWLKQEYGMESYIAVSRPVKHSDHLPKLYAELETQLENKFYQLDEHIFGYDGGTFSEDETPIQQKTDFQAILQENIRKKEIPQLWDNYYKLRQQIRTASMDSQMYIKFIFTELIRDIYEQMQAVGSEEMKADVEKLYQSGNLGSICEVIEGCIHKFEKNCLAENGSARSDVERIRRYIQYHVDEDLRIDQLAARVYLSQTYLSYIFKKETGMTISRYIRQCRMEKAKEFLTSTDMKIVQVCEKVGFSNVSYFCQSFREYTGVSPEKFRKSGENDENLD